MVANLSINPALTTNAQGLFSLTEDGLVQGCAMDDPAIRNALCQGILATDETLPMWGGVGIYEHLPPSTAGATTASATLGNTVGRATTETDNAAKELLAFAVFNQAVSYLNTPQSPVPVALSGNSVLYYRLGSGARIPVACDPALANAIDGGTVGVQVSWDFVNQRLVPYLGTLTITSGAYDNATGAIALLMSAPVTFGEGTAVILSSLTGTGAFASLNGTYTVVSTSGSTVNLLADAGLGASTITGGSVVLGSGASSALPVKVIAVDPAGAMTVEYDADTGFATWERNGAAAVILI